MNKRAARYDFRREATLHPRWLREPASGIGGGVVEVNRLNAGILLDTTMAVDGEYVVVGGSAGGGPPAKEEVPGSE